MNVELINDMKRVARILVTRGDEAEEFRRAFVREIVSAYGERLSPQIDDIHRLGFRLMAIGRDADVLGSSGVTRPLSSADVVRSLAAADGEPLSADSLVTEGPTLAGIIEAMSPGTRITIDRTYGEDY